MTPWRFGHWAGSGCAALTVAGTEFVYPEPQRADGQAWQHFRAPDGNIYEIIGPDDLPD